MSNRFVRPLLAIMIPFGILLVLLALATSISTTQAAQSFGASTDGANILPPGEQPLRPEDQDPNDEGITEPELIVVRAYFDDRQMVYELAGWNEPWDVRYDEGYLVIGVTGAEYDRLEAAGFRLEIDEEMTAEMNRVRVPNEDGGGIPGYACYRTVEETLDTISDMLSTYPTLATAVDIGDSWEKSQGLGGYDLMVLKLTNSEITGPKPKVFSMSGLHAREYAPPELSTRFAEYLLQNYGTDADATWILDHHEIHLLLHANPDGRKQAETGLSWRKNKNNNFCANSNNRGVDLNRNFTFSWDYCGDESCSSSSACSITYRGPSASSEPETQAVEAYVRAEFPDQREDPITAAAPITATGIFFDMHSYSELVLWAWGFDAVPPNETELTTLGRKLGYFNDYYPTQAIGLYPTDGTTDDFAYGELGLAAYTFEMGTSFFQACSTFENTILPDNMPALIYAAKVARTPYMTPAGPEALDLSLSEETVGIGQEVTLEATINDGRFNNDNGTEPTQPIAAAEYYIDVPPWVTTGTPVAFAMNAADSTFNSTVEGVMATIDTSGLSSGKHTIFVRGQDSAGNWGPFSALFLTVQANVTVSSNQFTPNSVTIATGESVTWQNEQGFHNVVADDGSFTSGAASSDNWTYSNTFDTAGTYQYYCEIHGGSGGSGMSGVIIVEEGPTPTPTPTITPSVTNTPMPATNTPMPATNTPMPATNTPMPATNTPMPATNTPTNTPVPIEADITVGSNFFDPNSFTIATGESVTWQNEQGFHNVVADDGSFTSGAASSDNWTYSNTFDTAGTYQYYCEIHGAPDGSGMSGVIIVEDGSTETPIPATETPVSATSTPMPSATPTATGPMTTTTTIDPQNGGTLGSGDVQVVFPSNAVTTTTTIIYTEQTTPTEDTGSFVFAGNSFMIEAFDSNNQSITTFNEPFSIIVTYNDAELKEMGIDEDSLTLAYWDGKQWVDLLPCEGCMLDTDNNLLTVVLNHLTEFALFGEEMVMEQQLYLPLITR